MKLPPFFEEDRALIEAGLERLLPGEHLPPATIHRAMRYSVFAGGKRVRPILCLEAARVLRPDAPGVVETACAFELIHTYSLIHDDLPALDDDDLRRGKPTCHKKFGEAMAILTGDALLTLAFECLGSAEVEAPRRAEIVREVARAAGTVNGMVGGQVADLEAGGQPVEPALLEYIHKSKTAALICAAIVSGAICGGANAEDVSRLRRMGAKIGWAFQVVDDILDVEETSGTLGKTAGKDQAQQKATYPALYGVEKSREIASRLESEALAELQPLGARAARLRELAQFLVARRA